MKLGADKASGRLNSGWNLKAQKEKCISRPSRFVNRAGIRYGKLLVLSLVEIRKHQTIWRCKCDCGKYHKAKGMNLASGSTKSCGCHKQGLLVAGLRLTHGHAVKGITPEYRAWVNMKTRCTNRKCQMYYRYGGRGIKVCDRWLDSFVNFIEDMGKKPTKKHSLERKETDGNYDPSNCVWATQKAQSLNTSRNRFVSFNGRRMTISEFCDLRGFCRSAIHSRTRRGWTLARALKTPNQKMSE